MSTIFLKRIALIGFSLIAVGIWTLTYLLPVVLKVIIAILTFGPGLLLLLFSIYEETDGELDAAWYNALPDEKKRRYQ